MLWTTIVATVLFGLYYANYVNGWITVADAGLGWTSDPAPPARGRGD